MSRGLDERSCPSGRSGGGRGRRPGDLVPDREAVGHHLSVVGRRQQVPTGPKVRGDAAELGHRPVQDSEADRVAGQDYLVRVALDEWSPLVSLSAIFDQAQSINAGYAVNV